jgi:hypothetical protein
MNRNLIFALALIAAPVLGGCGSSTVDDLDGGTQDAVAGPTLFGLTAGDSCFTITSIVPGFIDGCGLGVDTLVGTSLPMNYASATAVVTLGTKGSLGAGAIASNAGTLVRDGDTTFSGTTCTLHQTDTSQLQMTADNAFTVSVTEVESNFGTTCAAADVPATGTCTSTWTWTMQKSAVTTLVPPACGS